MKYPADEGLDKPIVTALRAAGFDVDYILELLPGSDDETVLQIANEQQRILITQDKDFGELVYRLRYTHHGIILIRLEGFAPDLKGSIVTNILRLHEGKLQNAFAVIQPNGLRIRK